MEATATAEREIVYLFRSGFENNGRSMYGWLRHANLNPQWGPDEFDEEGWRCSTITLDPEEVKCLRMMQDADPARYGTNPAKWSSRPDGRPDRIPQHNGLYWFKAHPTDNPRICQVTDNRVRFQYNRKGIPHQFLGHAAIFTPLTIDDMPPKDTEAFVITIDGGPGVAIPRTPGDPAPMPSQVLDAYAKEYAIPRKSLGWAIARFIPMPTIPGFND